MKTVETAKPSPTRQIFVEDFHDAPNISRFTLAFANSVIFVFTRQRVPATV